MSEVMQAPFLKFLEAGAEKGGFETDDVLAALVPLMRQARAAHGTGLVTPLNGIEALSVAEEGHLMFDAAKCSPPRRNSAKVEALQSPASRAVEVVAESRRTADVDESSLTVSDLGVGAASGGI